MSLSFARACASRGSDMARTFQHELDHLDGILYTSKMIPESYVHLSKLRRGREERKEDIATPPPRNVPKSAMMTMGTRSTSNASAMRCWGFDLWMTLEDESEPSLIE